MCNNVVGVFNVVGLLTIMSDTQRSEYVQCSELGKMSVLVGVSLFN